MKWIRLATAPDQLQAEMWRDVLVEEGVSAVVRPADTSTFLGVSTYPCGVMVDEGHLERARGIMKTRLGIQGEK